MRSGAVAELMRLFVTGTDTEVGKTQVSAALLHLCRQAGWSAVGMKPVAAGSRTHAGRESNEDVDLLTAASSIALPEALINPYLFRPAIAPHIAAAEVGISIDLAHIEACYQRLCAQAQAIVVEGAGGFLLPLGSNQDGGDLAQRLGLPVVLVVGMRLGCLNHALLTAEAIARRGLTLAGWVANRITPEMPRFDENLATLLGSLPAPLLGVVPFLPDPDPLKVASYLTLPLVQ